MTDLDPVQVTPSIAVDSTTKPVRDEVTWPEASIAITFFALCAFAMWIIRSRIP